MADFSRIDRNLKSMATQGASQDEVKQYLQYEGVTADQVLDATETVPEKIGRTVSDFAGSVVDTVRGEQDPAFAEVPGFAGEGLGIGSDIRSRIETGKLVTHDDAAFGDVVKEALGDRLIGVKKDANNNEVITYRGDDGQQHTSYINKPGLDFQDIDRGISAAVPAIAGGVVARGIGAGISGGLLARTGTMAATEGLVSIGQDVAAGTIGSEQGVDLERAGLSALLGGAFEGLAGPVKRAWTAIFGDKGVDNAGRLTPEAVEKAKAMGLDPDAMQGRLAEEFAKDLKTGGPYEEIAARARGREFNLKPSKGQMTKHPDQLSLEEEMRRNLLGEEATRVIDAFDKTQKDAIEKAIRNQIGGRLSPFAPGTEPATLGQAISGAMRQEQKAMKRQANKLWDDTGPMYPSDVGFNMMRPNMRKALDSADIRPTKDMPATSQIMNLLEQYRRGEVPDADFVMLANKREGLTLDDVRRRVRQLADSADIAGGDKKAAEALYGGYLGWIDDLAVTSALHGAPDAAVKLKAATGFYKDFKQLFAPRKGRKLTPAAKIIEQVTENADTPERVIDTIFGAGGPLVRPKPGTVPALHNMRKILQKNSPRDWDNLRLAYWARIAQDKRGHVLSPGKLRNNIEAAMENQASAMNALYSKAEIGEIRRLGQSLDDLVTKPLNPSGSSYEIRRLNERFRKDSIAKTTLRAMQQRETFAKHNFLMARVYQVLAKKLPVSLFGSRDIVGGTLARRATDPKLPRRLPSSWGIGGAAGEPAQDIREE